MTLPLLMLPLTLSLMVFVQLAAGVETLQFGSEKCKAIILLSRPEAVVVHLILYIC